jgi:hypothetical protein
MTQTQIPIQDQIFWLTKTKDFTIKNTFLFPQPSSNRGRLIFLSQLDVILCMCCIVEHGEKSITSLQI